MSNQSHPDAFEQLAASCQGAVLHPGDARYEQTCAGWNLAWTQRPAVVVRASSEADVIHAVRYAAAQELSVAVQNTGHGVTVPADDQSVLISTKGLDQVTIDPHAGTATIGGGTTWGPVLAAAQEHGLAPLLGSAPHVGSVGYSLGGGFGWLARKHGLAVDAVRALRVVLADGRAVTTSPTEESELFWAMCGTAGGSLGVVVDMTVALVPVTDVYAGNLFYPLDVAREVFDRYVSWTDHAPEELTSAFNITAFPPLDIVPEPLRGNTFVIVRGCFAGAPGDETGQQLVDQWRSWRGPLMDTWATIPFARSAEIAMDPVDPVPTASSGRWLTALDGTVLEAMLDAVVGGDSPSPMLFAETRHGGGATHRENSAVSFGVRDGQRMLELVGMITAPGTDAELERRFEITWQRLSAHLAPLPGFLNFAEGHEKIQIARHAFDDQTRQRLTAAKHNYDPRDGFRHGIPLASSGARASHRWGGGTATGGVPEPGPVRGGVSAVPAE